MPAPSTLTHAAPARREGPAGGAARLLGAAAAPPRAAARAAAALTSGGIRAATRLTRGIGAALDLGPQRHGRRMWLGRRSGVIEVRGLGPDDGTDRRALGEAVQTALRGLRGVRWAQVNAATGHALVLFDDALPDGGRAGLGDVLDAVTGVEEAFGTAGHGWSKDAPPHPADPAALTGAVVALAADVAGLGAAVAGRLARIGPVPSAARATVGLVEAQPRLRRLAERALSPAGADLAIGVASGIVHGLSEGVGPLLVTGLSHAQLVAEVRSRRAVWEAQAVELCTAPDPGRPPGKTQRVTPFPAGPVESFTDGLAAASLVVAGGVLAATADVNRAAALLLVGVPPAARLGREAFAATLARRLAGQGVVPLDPGAFRRLDRVSALVVDPAALGTRGARLAAALREPADGHPAPAPSQLVVVTVDRVEPARAETPLKAVQRLQAAGHGVLVVTAGDDDALAAADVAVAVRRPGGSVGWTADLLCGPDPVPALVLLAAVPAARRASRRAVGVAGAGSLAATLLTALSPLPYSDLTMQPVYLSGLLTQLDGARAARDVVRSVTDRATARPAERPAP